MKSLSFEKKVIKHIHSLDTKSVEFQMIAETVSKKVHELRDSEGKLPYPLFISSIEMSGVSACIEVFLVDEENNLYLRKRTPSENNGLSEKESWDDLLHLPGTTIFPSKTFEDNYRELLEREVIKGSGDKKKETAALLYAKSEVLGVGMHDELARHTNALDIYLKVVITDTSVLQDGFEIVNKKTLSSVIPDHLIPIKKIFGHTTGPLLFDTRVNY